LFPQDATNGLGANLLPEIGDRALLIRVMPQLVASAVTVKTQILTEVDLIERPELINWHLAGEKVGEKKKKRKKKKKKRNAREGFTDNAGKRRTS
jgi:hypothetical protein